MWIFFSYLGETYHLVQTYGSEEEERRQWHCHFHDEAHGAFVTLYPYTSTREQERNQDERRNKERASEEDCREPRRYRADYDTPTSPGEKQAQRAIREACSC